MSNFLLKNPNCVFIHIPKTAGTSIRKGVWKSDYEGPYFGTIPKEWENLFSFAFVRHPLQRFVSAYHMFTEGAKGDPAWSLPHDARVLTIEEFLEIVLDQSIIYDQRRHTFEEKIRHHTIPQTHPFNCLHLAKFIGRYENFNKDFETIKKEMGIINEVPHIHYTKKVNWKDILKGEVLDKCITFYKNDFEELNYTYVSQYNVPSKNSTKSKKGL